MHVACASHPWFNFNLNTKTRYIYRLHITIFTWHIMPHPICPLHSIFPCLLTWRTTFFSRGDECPSTLASGLQKLPHPLLCASHPFTPHSSYYIIYIEDISNLGCLGPGQFHCQSCIVLGYFPCHCCYNFMTLVAFAVWDLT